MRARVWMLAGALALLAVAGCGKKEDSTTAGSAADSAAVADSMAAARDSAVSMSDRERESERLSGGAIPPPPAASGGRNRPRPPRGDGSGGSGTPAPPKVTYADIPAGNAGEMGLTAALSSETSKEGDTFTAELAAPVSLDGRVVLPAGTRVLGHVVYAEPAKRGKTKAKLILSYDKFALSGGEAVDIDAKPDTFEAGGTTTRDVATVGAGAVIGGILGKISGNTKKGAAIGAVVGGGAAVAARGKPVELPAGQKVNLVLQSGVKVPVSKGGA
ncbi:MAG: hypothetical protein HZB25_04505 [Candidatus Eisenbacteria bacterium]|nr:hypothetical protein [Candidatus Eisenbacteria bacterium]